jgi:hypothetical protein
VSRSRLEAAAHQEHVGQPVGALGATNTGAPATELTELAGRLSALAGEFRLT